MKAHEKRQNVDNDAKISIKPGGKNIIRFTIKNIGNLEKGNYDNLLVIKEKKPSMILENEDNNEELSFSFKYTFLWRRVKNSRTRSCGKN